MVMAQDRIAHNQIPFRDFTCIPETHKEQPRVVFRMFNEITRTFRLRLFVVPLARSSQGLITVPNRFEHVHKINKEYRYGSAIKRSQILDQESYLTVAGLFRKQFNTLHKRQYSASGFVHGLYSCLTQSTSIVQSELIGESLILAKFSTANKGSGN